MLRGEVHRCLRRASAAAARPDTTLGVRSCTSRSHASLGEACGACDECWMSGGSPEECEATCEPCWHSYEECDKCSDSCGGCPPGRGP